MIKNLRTYKVEKANMITYLHQSIEGKCFAMRKEEKQEKILGKLCEWKGVEITEGNLMPEHARIWVSIPFKMSTSGFIGDLKGKMQC